MQGIEFDDDKNIGGILTKTSQFPLGRKSFMLKLLKKAGIENRDTANMTLFGIAIVFFAVTIYLYAGILGSGMPSKLTQEEMEAQIIMLRGTIPPR